MKTQYKNILSDFIFLLRYFTIFIFLFTMHYTVIAQCPGNIDFEKGDFTGWNCFTGTIDQNGLIRLTPSFPTVDRHEIYDADHNQQIDEWGNFPKVCPNGSRYSIRLGNNIAGWGAERISYKFTIPSNQNDFSLIYNYAVVLEDYGHAGYQQPRLTIKVLNVTDNAIDLCSSFDFVVSGSLPGFNVSPNMHNGIPVRYKDWSSAFINLNGNAGKTFEISFTTTDCSVGGHFGYAYIDINTNCSSTLAGSVFCPDDKFLNLTAPPGFKSYKWFNTSNATLGTGQTLYLNPPPASGEKIYVAFLPYSGYGCVDTLAAYLSDTLTVTANAGPDKEFCANPSIRLGVNPTPGEIYIWSPTVGLTDPDISNPVASPLLPTQYTLTATSAGGGCKTTDVVNLIKKCGIIEIYVPNAFAPNSIGVNHTLRPFLYGYSKVNYFRVYNRYGQLLYSADSDKPGWDGTIKGKALPTQTVVWMIEAVDAYGRIEKRQGTAILLR
jgi:gliding motility-associated-like protein